jgi:pimeloyl-ACP methyl ester carboxylesterase
MPNVTANGINHHYEQQGAGEPLILIPYLAADNACYAFQVADYAKHFTCISLDLRGTGESASSEEPYSTEDLADDVAAVMAALKIERAHVVGLSLGAAVGMWFAAKHRDRVTSLSLHSGWDRSDPFLKNVVQGWQVMAGGLSDVAAMVIQGIFPWCFTPELYAARPEYIESLADFVRGRPRQTLEAFILQSGAVIEHDATAALASITAPTQITFGRHDLVTSTRFAKPLTQAIPKSELHVFADCSHAPIYENVAAFNEVSLAFLKRHAG